MSQKLRIGIIFGGKSAEHEISLQSARNVIEAIDREKYEIILLGINKDGQWQLVDETEFLLHENSSSLVNLKAGREGLAFCPGQYNGSLVSMTNNKSIGAIDVAFPILHGPFGEDGTVQGFLKLAGIPFVGPGVLGSAVGMDKDVTKRLLRDSGIPVADFIVAHADESCDLHYDHVKSRLGVPFFVKPANLGSSVGVHKVHDSNEFLSAMKEAFSFDNKVLIEAYVEGREIECAILGNEDPIASEPGEILPSHEFYSYEAKYIDEKGAVLEIPAKLPEQTAQRIKTTSIAAFKAICCEGMARVDSFLRKDGSFVVNELNTIPGFTAISMYPKLWEAGGLKLRDLIDRLIELALERHAREKRLRTTHE